jgi:hypothetical protein
MACSSIIIIVCVCVCVFKFIIVLIYMNVCLFPKKNMNVCSMKWLAKKKLKLHVRISHHFYLFFYLHLFATSTGSLVFCFSCEFMGQFKSSRNFLGTMYYLWHKL